MGTIVYFPWYINFIYWKITQPYKAAEPEPSDHRLLYFFFHFDWRLLTTDFFVRRRMTWSERTLVGFQTWHLSINSIPQFSRQNQNSGYKFLSISFHGFTPRFLRPELYESSLLRMPKLFNFSLKWQSLCLFAHANNCKNYLIALFFFFFFSFQNQIGKYIFELRNRLAISPFLAPIVYLLFLILLLFFVCIVE